MTYDQANDHAAFRESIAAALAGGLSAAEQAAFDAHRAACPDCAAEFERAKESESRMTTLFAPALPAAGFEDRLIQCLRESAGAPRRWRFARPNWRIHPAIGKAVAGVAAAIVLGGVGYAVNSVIQEMPAADSQVLQVRRPASTTAAATGEWYGSEGIVAAQRNSQTTERRRTVADLQAQAGRLTAESRYGEALGVVDQILTLDVENGYATSVRPLIEGKAARDEQRGRGDFDRQFTKQLNQSGERKVPYDDLLRYPANGTEISELGDNLHGGLKSGVAPQPATPAPALAPVPAQEGAEGNVRRETLHETERPAVVLDGVVVAGKPASGGGGGGGSGGRGGEDGKGAPAENGRAAQPNARWDVEHAAKPADSNWFKPTELGREWGEIADRTPQAVEQETLKADVSGPTPSSAAGAMPTPALPAITATPPPSDGPAAGQAGVPVQELPPAAGGNKPAAAADFTGRVVLGAEVVKTPPAAANPVREAEPTTRKVIRNGEMSFEVDRFDSAFAQVSKLTSESGGYVGTTSSEKLPNGKVQGKVTVRVPPDRLDTLVLQLRGIGDLKSQSLEAQDVSKKYTDLESQLRAARAMEERLIAIIKEGKGQIKDLLAAEKELGNWRTKVEELTGEMKYYDSLVSLATLNLTLTERDIETPATAYESENVDAGVESEDVENARAAALKAIEEAKGRVVQSDLKRHDAGQFSATIVAEVPPDNAGPLLDRLKQVGKVARLDVQRKQTASEKKSVTASRAPVRVEKRDTRFNLSIYNLANVAPRQTVAMDLAADDVEKAYQAVLDRVAKAGGRVVTSNLNRQKPEQTTGRIEFHVPAAAADAVAGDVRAAGEPIKVTVTENPDVQNVTAAKRGFVVDLRATAAVAPRETATVQLAAADVAQAREKILSVAGAQAAQIRASQLNENDRQNITASLELDVKRAALPAVEKVLADAGQVVRRNVARSNDAENTLDTKVRLQLTLLPADRLPPRETTTLTVELGDVESAMASLQAAAIEAGGRVAVSNLAKDRDGRGVAKVVVDVPLDKSSEIVRRTRELGVVRAIDASKDLQVPPGGLARARVDVTFANADTLVAPERGVFASIRRGLSTSLEGLMWSLQLIIVGICFVLPWALVLYAIWRLIKRRRRGEPATPPAAAPA